MGGVNERERLGVMGWQYLRVGGDDVIHALRGMKAAFVQASERWCQISFLGGLLTCGLYLLTENWWSAVFALCCGAGVLCD